MSPVKKARLFKPIKDMTDEELNLFLAEQHEVENADIEEVTDAEVEWINKGKKTEVIDLCNECCTPVPKRKRIEPQLAATSVLDDKRIQDAIEEHLKVEWNNRKKIILLNLKMINENPSGYAVEYLCLREPTNGNVGLSDHQVEDCTNSFCKYCRVIKLRQSCQVIVSNIDKLMHCRNASKK